MSPVAWSGVETFGGLAFVAPVYQSLDGRGAGGEEVTFLLFS